MTISPELAGQTKIDHLRDLIVSQVAEAGEITLIARSADSPVVMAAASARDTLVERGASVRIVFLQHGSRMSDAFCEAVSVDTRLALNPRLLEAHEQMVVGNAIWLGDCMRRDPLKRDAFTQVKVGCAVTSTFAALSFEKLWAIGTPVIGAPVLSQSPINASQSQGA
jgi:hypothetical protein